ncbi:hypothetical protein J0A67_05710 [Algoriphagus aestuariicola]|uniref:Leucine-rich repeat domain-containing protein n=1 Tax=Algoriphagus aestuariicola TaxID=1852016 RepID=A0ABS3BMX1_9BACT|nr:hypothetical protein [Algoriphagus aestuariicola]MBN7800347.1 hypothetical protein [Algoriphagus aestuariicola]
MAKRTQAKLLKKLQQRFGKLYASMEPYYHHLDFRRFDDFDDDAFAYLMEKVKGVNMLDLNETDISNESIALLPRMEYVKEIRAKSCKNLDDGCVPFLNQIKSLEFLHLRYSGVTIDGLLQLTDQAQLKTLMFSEDDPENIVEKLAQLRKLLPACELVINGQPLLPNSLCFK